MGRDLSSWCRWARCAADNALAAAARTTWPKSSEALSRATSRRAAKPSKASAVIATRGLKGCAPFVGNCGRSLRVCVIPVKAAWQRCRVSSGSKLDSKSPKRNNAPSFDIRTSLANAATSGHSATSLCQKPSRSTRGATARRASRSSSIEISPEPSSSMILKSSLASASPTPNRAAARSKARRCSRKPPLSHITGNGDGTDPEPAEVGVPTEAAVPTPPCCPRMELQ
mmetsp:Transcript_59995/g.168138  ORF Transcript_59995/g.168138 Transcript_59995/m.168138 type:complete len:227 (+) Transcript_59995:356-1036(+)